jgi:hypothetical protein
MVGSSLHSKLREDAVAIRPWSLYGSRISRTCLDMLLNCVCTYVPGTYINNTYTSICELRRASPCAF